MITITDGFYSQKHFNKQFEAKIYKWRNPKTSKVENVCLVPTWVQEKPKSWKPIKGQLNKNN